ncbi:hypothetical protein FACS1894192_08100 [Bacilli bacterium]|nr:hypothetical protein FACS1894192_08100 [Bacilli bacterium]
MTKTKTVFNTEVYDPNTLWQVIAVSRDNKSIVYQGTGDLSDWTMEIDFSEQDFKNKVKNLMMIQNNMIADRANRALMAEDDSILNEPIMVFETFDAPTFYDKGEI